MKKLLLTLAALAALALPGWAQTTNTAPLIIAPVTQTLTNQPCQVTLTPAQVAVLVTVLAQNGVTFSGSVQSINLHLSFAKAPGAQGIVTFYPTAPTK
jgi:hypothetical protein